MPDPLKNKYFVLHVPIDNLKGTPKIESMLKHTRSKLSVF